MSLSLSLLTIFSKETCFGSDMKAYRERSQVLSIIYLNISIFVMNTGFEIATWFFLSPSNYSTILTFVTFPCVILCFVSLKMGKKEMSAVILLGYMHFTNIFASAVMEIPMAAIIALMIFPTFSFFLTTSHKIYIMNIILCLANMVYHVHKTNEIFEATLDKRQATQIQTFIIGAIIAFIVHFTTSYIQKGMENSVWKMAQIHYDKSKALMMDILQAVKAKEEYAESLSRLMQYPVSMLNEAISQLLEFQGDPDKIQLLKNAKLVINGLLTLINNKFDISKLKPEFNKMELVFSDIDIFSMIQRGLMLNSANLRKNNNGVKVFLSENVPATVRTDPTTFLQLMISPIMDSARHVEKDAKIELTVTWEDENQNKEALLTSDDDYVARNRPANDNQEKKLLISPSKSLSCSSLTADPHTGEDPSKSQRNIIRTNTFKKKWTLENSLMAQGDGWKIFKFHPPLNRSQGPHGSISFYQTALKEKASQKRRGYLKMQISYLGAGNGMTQEEIIRLLDNNASQTFGTSEDGSKTTHLGFWITRQLCLRLGGDIRLDNHANQVTTCVFYIPVNMNQRTSFQQKVVSAPHDRVSVLIVDGYTSTRDLYKLQLERKGVMVNVAVTSKEALQKLQMRDEDYFDFVMLDIQTLETSGFETIKAIRDWEAVQQRKKVDIYLLSDEFDTDEALSELKRRTGKTVSSEGIWCLKKPIIFETLSNCIEKYNRDRKKSRNQEDERNLKIQTRSLTSEDLGVRFRKNL